MGKRVDLAVIRRDRALALGCCDSIQYVTGHAPRPHTSRIAATVIGYVLLMLAGMGVIAMFASQ